MCHDNARDNKWTWRGKKEERERERERESWWRMNWHYVAVRVKDTHTHTHTHTHRWMVKEMRWVQREFTNKRKGCERETSGGQKREQRVRERWLRDSGLVLKRERESLYLFWVFHLRQSVWEQSERLFEQWQLYSAKNSTEEFCDSVTENVKTPLMAVFFFALDFNGWSWLMCSVCSVRGEDVRWAWRSSGARLLLTVSEAVDCSQRWSSQV